MKCISIWQPFATLIVKGYKIFETRTWAPPRSVIGQEIGIAATKNILPAQRGAFADEEFQSFYKTLEDMPQRIEDLPCGYLIGTATLDSFELIDEEFLDEITLEERAYGWFKLGGYAWRMMHPKMLNHPIPIKGAQGFFDYRGFDHGSAPQTEDHNDKSPREKRLLRTHLSLS